MILDSAKVTIVNNVLIGPRVSIYTENHPIDAAIRRQGYELAQPVTIEDDVWLGGNVIVNSGVTIGEGSVIGSGSVVVKDYQPIPLRSETPERLSVK